MVHAYKDVPLARRSHTILMYLFSLVVSSGRPSGAGTFAALASFELFASAVERRKKGGKEGRKEERKEEEGRVEGRREERREKDEGRKEGREGRKEEKKGKGLHSVGEKKEEERRKEKEEEERRRREVQCQYSV